MLSVGRTLGLRSKKLWYLNLSSSTSFSFTSCSIRDLDESNHLHSPCEPLELNVFNRTPLSERNSASCHSILINSSALKYSTIHRSTSNYKQFNQTTKPLRKVHLTPGWFWLCPAGTGACRVSPGCLVRRLAGWQRGCWDCPQTRGCPRTRQRWATAGCRPWSRRWGSWSYCTGPDWSRCSLKTQSHQLVLERQEPEEKRYYTPNEFIKYIFIFIFIWLFCFLFFPRIQLVHCTFTDIYTASRGKKGEHFSQSTHTCSLARPASGQQHHVTTSPHFADECLQQCTPADGGTDVDQHADDALHDQGHPLTHSQKTCRNALHTANYCTTRHREERGSAGMWEDVQITKTWMYWEEESNIQNKQWI